MCKNIQYTLWNMITIFDLFLFILVDINFQKIVSVGLPEYWHNKKTAPEYLKHILLLMLKITLTDFIVFGEERQSQNVYDKAVTLNHLLYVSLRTIFSLHSINAS